jgi:hypothetical protein
MTTENRDSAAVNDEEYAATTEDAQIAEGTYTHKFKKPFTHMGKTYEELNFDFTSLTGRDGLAIETELQALRIPALVPSLSAPYLVRLAAKACTERIGSDAFELMPLQDYERIKNAARSFLLSAE